MEWPYRIPYPHALQLRPRPTPVVVNSFEVAMHHLRGGRVLRCSLCRCGGATRGRGYDVGRAFKIQDGIFYHQNRGAWETSPSGRPPEDVIYRWLELGHEFKVE